MSTFHSQSEINRQGSEAPAEDPCRASQRSMAEEKNCAAPRRPQADDKDVNFSQRSDRTLLRKQGEESNTSEDYTLSLATPWDRAFVAAIEALRQPSFLGLVRHLHDHGHRFRINRTHPSVRVNGENYRLEHLNLLGLFRGFIDHHEGYIPRLMTQNAETKALAARVTWIALSNYTDDLPDQRRSLEHFAIYLSEAVITDAMAKAWSAPHITSREHRWKYTCSILHPLRRQNIAARKADKAVFTAAFAQPVTNTNQ